MISKSALEALKRILKLIDEHKKYTDNGVAAASQVNLGAVVLQSESALRSLLEPTEARAEAEGREPDWKQALIDYRRELQTDLANLEEHHPNNESVAQAMRSKLNAVQECFSRIHGASPLPKAEQEEVVGPRVLPCKQCGAEYDRDPCLFPNDCHVPHQMTSAPAALSQQKGTVPTGYAHVFLRSIGQEQIPDTIVSAPSALPSAANAEAAAREIGLLMQNYDTWSPDKDRIADFAAIIRKHASEHAGEQGWVDKHKFDVLERQYDQLLMAVLRKHKDESRHATALRYIREAEELALPSGADKAAAPDSAGGKK